MLQRSSSCSRTVAAICAMNGSCDRAASSNDEGRHPRGFGGCGDGAGQAILVGGGLEHDQHVIGTVRNRRAVQQPLGIEALGEHVR